VLGRRLGRGDGLAGGEFGLGFERGTNPPAPSFAFTQTSRPSSQISQGIFVQLSAADHHTCGIMLDESLVCWGGDSLPPALSRRRKGPAGDATAAAAAAAAAATRYLQVSSGSDVVCAIAHDGSLRCWGEL
jgi:hypothetical protein